MIDRELTSLPGAAAPASQPLRGAGDGERGDAPAGPVARGATVLAEREAADGVSVEVELHERLGRAAAELRVGAALANREAELPVAAGRVALAPRPLGRAADGVCQLAP